MQRIVETALVASRWLLAPLFGALALAIVGLVVKAGQRVFEIAGQLASLSQPDVILGALGLVDLTLTASLIVIVIFSGYANFISRIDANGHDDWPQWMASIDFSALKLKLLASIVAISAIKLLEAFMDVGHESDRDLKWLVGIHLVFVASTLLLAVVDRIGPAEGGKAPH